MTPDEAKPRSSLAVWLVVGLLLLPVAYVLFAGPAVWLFQHGYGQTLLPAVYKPLIWLEQSNTSIGNLVRWYLELWK